MASKARGHEDFLLVCTVVVSEYFSYCLGVLG